MKEHAKKALKHDFEVAGKTIPTLAVAILFLVGTGSAALLSSFGTVSGGADVTQAVTVNGNSADEGSITDSYDLVSVAGDSSVYAANLSNNLDSNVPVEVNTELVKSPSVDSSVADENTEEQSALTTRYYTVDALVSEDNSENIDSDTSDVKEVTTDGHMTSEVVYYEAQDRAAVHAYGQTIQATNDSQDQEYVNSGTSTSYAGAKFDVDGVEYTGGKDLVVDYAVGSDHRGGDDEGTTPDWITYNVSYEGDNYYLQTFTADQASPDNPFQMSGGYPGSVQVIFDEEGIVWRPEAEDSEVTPSELQDSGSAEIQDITISTGSGADDDTFVDMYYYGVSIGDSELFAPTDSENFGSLDLESGNTQLVVENSFDVAAVPGEYEVETDIQPQNSN